MSTPDDIWNNNCIGLIGNEAENLWMWAAVTPLLAKVLESIGQPVTWITGPDDKAAFGVWRFRTVDHSDIMAQAHEALFNKAWWNQ